MITIRRIQYEKVRDLYRRLIISRGDNPSSYDIDKLAREILLSTLRTPLSGKYRLPSHEEVNIDSLNAELGLVKADAETIYDYLDAVQKRMRTLRYVSSVWKQNAKSKVSSTLVELAKMTSPTFIQGFTEELSPMEIMSEADTTLAIGEDGSITLPMMENSARRYKHRRADINVSRISGSLIRRITGVRHYYRADRKTATILGRLTNVVNLDERGSAVLNLKGSTVEESGFRINISTDTEAVNFIYLQLADVRNGIKVKVEVSSNRVDFITVYESVTTRERIDIPIAKTDIKSMYVTLTMDIPSRVTTEGVEYEFKIDKILMLNDYRTASGTYQTKEITLEDDIAIVSLATEETSTDDCTISYFMTTEKDTDGDPVGFTYIDTKAEGSFLSVESGVAKTQVALPEGTNYWKLSPVKTYGAKLYNILESAEEEATEDYTVGSGEITIAEGDIVQDSMKLYRGVGDYVQLTRDITIDRQVDWISIRPELYDETDWIKRVPLRITINELITDIANHGDGLYNNFSLPYTMLNYEQFKITRSDGTPVTDLITNINAGRSITYVVLAAEAGQIILDPAYKYHAEYTVSLKQYADANDMTVELDLDSIEITSSDSELVYETDFQVYEDDLEVEIFKTGVYQNNYEADYDDPENPTNLCEPINIKYSYTGTIEAETVYYETHVYSTAPIDITVLPFTASEIASGNFHVVNGEFYSASTLCTLQKGWNPIETTQPFPSLNEYDLNNITGEQSGAGLVIPDDLEMRAYMDSMRQVSPYKLATLGTDDGSNCFSYSEGMILTNFLPTFIDENFLNTDTTSNIVGSKFLNKKASYSTTYTNVGWTSVPEKFGLEFGHVVSGDKVVFVKATMETTSSSAFGKIIRMGLNKYKEI